MGLILEHGALICKLQVRHYPQRAPVLLLKLAPWAAKRGIIFATRKTGLDSAFPGTEGVPRSSFHPCFPNPSETSDRIDRIYLSTQHSAVKYRST